MDLCLRSKLKKGEKLNISCVHAEMVAMFKMAKTHEVGDTYTLYLWGSNGASLPCVDCLKYLIYFGCNRIVFAGKDDDKYTCDISIPVEWLNVVDVVYLPNYQIN